MNQTLKILSYNIHKGFALSRRFVLESMRQAIRDVHADVVFLQEVQGQHDGHAKTVEGWAAKQFEYLADDVWPHFAYGKNAVYSEGDHGNAILSKYPIKMWENVDVSTNRFEKRGILHSIVEWNGAPLHLLCVHLNLTERGRARQTDMIIHRVETKIPQNERLILAGDFNDWRGRATKRFHDKLGFKEVFIETTGQHVKSFPAMWPFLTLDRVYVRGMKVKSARCHSDPPWSALSDHLAVESELEAD